MDDKISKRVLEMYRAGKKTAEITKTLGISRTTLYKVLHDAQVTPHRKSVPRSGRVPRGTELEPEEHQRLLDWALERVIELEHLIAERDVRLRTIADLAS